MHRVVRSTRRPTSWLRTPLSEPATRMLPGGKTAHEYRPLVALSRRPARPAADVPLAASVTSTSRRTPMHSLPRRILTWSGCSFPRCSAMASSPARLHNAWPFCYKLLLYSRSTRGLMRFSSLLGASLRPRAPFHSMNGSGRLRRSTNPYGPLNQRLRCVVTQSEISAIPMTPPLRKVSGSIRRWRQSARLGLSDAWIKTGRR
jgi:hypothetical protein